MDPRAAHDIRSARTLRHLSPAIGSWHAFGRYDRVLLDLSAFSDASPDLHAVLADDVRKAAAAGRRLDFVPPGCAGRSGARHRRADVMADSQGPGEGR